MRSFRIYMKTGMMHEAEAKNEITALQKVWHSHYYDCYTFVKFIQQVERTVEL